MQISQQNLKSGADLEIKKLRGKAKIQNKKVKAELYDGRDFILKSNHTEQDRNQFFYQTKIHQLATRVGDESKEVAEDENIKETICPCCGRYVHKEELKISNQSVALDFLGPGYPLFFQYIKFSGIFLLIMILSAGSYNFFSNSIDPACTDEKGNSLDNCPLTWISRFSLADKRYNSDLNQLQMILNIFTIISMILLLQFFRYSQREIEDKCDTADISPTDYTIWVKGLPDGVDAMKKQEMIDKLNESLRNVFGDKHQEIDRNEISFSYQVDKLPFSSLEQQKAEKIKEYQTKLNTFYGENPTYQDRIGKQLEGEDEIRQEIENLKKDIKIKQDEFYKHVDHEDNEEGDDTNHYFTGNLFFAVHTEQYKHDILKKLHKFDWQYKENTYQVKLFEAPDPSDVFWENLHYTKFEKVIRYFISLGANFIALFISFLIIYYLSEAQFFLNQRLNGHSTSKLCQQSTLRQGVSSASGLTSSASYIQHPHSTHQQEQEYYDTSSIQMYETRDVNNEPFIYHFFQPMIDTYRNGIESLEYMFSYAHDSISSHYAKVTAKDSSSSTTTPKDTPSDSSSDSTTNSNDPNESRDRLLIRLITALISFFVIPGFNFVLVKVMTMTTFIEKPTTNTQFQISLATKLTIGYFFNTALQTFITKVSIIWSEECLASARQSIYSPGGLIYTQQSVLMMNAVQAPLIYLVDSARCMKVAYRWYYLTFKKDSCSLTQVEANIQKERATYVIAERYAFLLNTLFITAFYAPLLPIGLVYSLICVLIIYWLEKYKVIHEKFIAFNLSGKISREMIEILELFLPLYCVANIIFDFIIVQSYLGDVQKSNNGIVQIYNHSSIYAKLGVIIGVVHAILPMGKFNEFCFPTEGEEFSNDHNLDQAKQFFNTTYGLENPATKDYKLRERALKNQQNFSQQLA